MKSYRLWLSALGVGVMACGPRVIVGDLGDASVDHSSAGAGGIGGQGGMGGSGGEATDGSGGVSGGPGGGGATAGTGGVGGAGAGSGQGGSGGSTTGTSGSGGVGAGGSGGATEDSGATTGTGGVGGAGAGGGQGGSGGSTTGTSGSGGIDAGSSAAGRAGWGGSSGAGGETFDAANCTPSRDAGGTVTDFDASAPPGTFFCWTIWDTQQNLYCLTDTEYCAVASFNGSTVAGPVCRPLNGCSTCECMKADAACVFYQGPSSCLRFGTTCLDATTSPPAKGPTVFCSSP